METTAPREAVETRSSIDRAVATTGDIITYRVTVDYDQEYEVEIPETGAEIAGFRITDVGSEEPVRRDGRVVEERWYKLRADLVGSYVLPPVAVSYRRHSAEGGAPPEGTTSDPSAGGEEAPVATDGGEAPPQGASADGFETVETSAIFVEVESVLPEDGEADDIRDLKPLRETTRPIPWRWIRRGAALVLALAAAAGWWLRRRRQKGGPPPLPAHVVAFEGLDALRGTDFDDPAAVRRFHFRISELIRAYVEGRFGLNATDLTTEEIVEALSAVRELGEGEGESLRRFLGDTDRVKFAEYAPTKAEIEATYERALAFVEATQPREDEGSGEAPAEGDVPREEAA